MPGQAYVGLRGPRATICGWRLAARVAVPAAGRLGVVAVGAVVGRTGTITGLGVTIGVPDCGRNSATQHAEHLMARHQGQVVAGP